MTSTAPSACSLSITIRLSICNPIVYTRSMNRDAIKMVLNGERGIHTKEPSDVWSGKCSSLGVDIMSAHAGNTKQLLRRVSYQ